MLNADSDTIAAIATPVGRGGVGVVRISGDHLETLIFQLLGKTLKPRMASYSRFLSASGEAIDEGIAIYFPGPGSFTGEDVLELQGHGGAVVQTMLLRRVLELGVRQARPGEFSERAFINGKMDLTQVEAVADLVNASSETAAKSALRSLQGEFSARIKHLVADLIRLRAYVESAIDFPEEDIDFLADSSVEADISALSEQVQQILANARQGALLAEGTTVAIVGRPNAGKSSLLNALSGSDTAIVTDVPGTTRDVLREAVLVDDLPLHLVDTAGLRETDDVVEREGVRRAWSEIETADQILYVVDSEPLPAALEFDPEVLRVLSREWSELSGYLEEKGSTPDSNVCIVLNKTDVSRLDAAAAATLVRVITGGQIDIPTLVVSAATGEGLALLKAHLHSCAGFRSGSEGVFSARQRHIAALEAAQKHLRVAGNLMSSSAAGELVAEELRVAQGALGKITGEFGSDDLLGEIFSNFCVGK